MGNRPKPRTISDEEIEKAIRSLPGCRQDRHLKATVVKACYLSADTHLSTFGFFAEILAYLVAAGSEDPEWLEGFSARVRAEEQGATITIPLNWLGPLAYGWNRYRFQKDNPDNRKLTLGQAMGVEPIGRGKRGDREAFEKHELDWWLAMQVIDIISSSAQNGDLISQEEAIARLSEHLEPTAGRHTRRKRDGRKTGVSEQRIRTAFAKHSPRIYKVFEEGGARLAPINFAKSKV